MTKTIMLLLTYDCNLRCSYCYEPKVQGKVMSAEDAMDFISGIVSGLGEEYESFEVQFMGGEPLLRFDVIAEVSEWLWNTEWSKRLESVFVVTNGTLLAPGSKEWLEENRDRICLGLSFDGNMQMQNENRSKSYDAVDLRFFSGNWPKQAVKMTVSPYTLRHLAEGIEFLHSEGFENIVVDLANGSRIGWCSNHLGILRQQLMSLSAFYRENPHLRECSLLRVDVFDVCRDDEVGKSCGCGETLVCVDTDGKQYACHLFSPIACDEGLSRQAQNIDFSDHGLFRNDVCDGCSLKMLCPHCYGMNYSETGELGKQDSFVCQSFKVIYLQNCRHRLLKAVEDGDQSMVETLSAIIKEFKNNQQKRI